MKVLLELIRIVFLFVIIGGFASALLNFLYMELGYKSGWFGSLGILGLLFVWYRNKLQFSGWYTGRGREKLSPKIAKGLILASVLLLLMPLILSFK